MARKLTFKDLSINDVFIFSSEIEFPFSGMVKGPWIKTSARTYINVNTGSRYRVGSIRAEVIREKLNPVSMRKLPGGGYRVSHDGKVSATRTTKRKAESQARLLRGVRHGMIPRNARRSPGYVLMFGPGGNVQSIYTVPEALKLMNDRPDLYVGTGRFGRSFNSLTAAKREATRINKRRGSPARPRPNHRDPLLGPKPIKAKRNPRRTRIYDRVGSITAQKGPGHRCDAECKAANHWYEHKFSTKNPVYGEPDGAITIE